MNRLWFAIMEGFKGLGRAKLAGTATVAALAVALFLIGTFVLLTLQAQFFLKGIQEKENIEIFLENSISEKEAAGLQKGLASLSWVDDVTYISKEDAAQRFKEDFGEDVIEVTGYNPLPPSFIVRVRWEGLQSSSLDSLAKKLRTLPEVSEVIYQDKLLTHLRKYRKIIFQGGIIIGAIVTIIAIFLVGNTIRLSIYSKRQIITLMELVGANRTMIHLPFLIEGAIQGLLGGACGACLTWLLFRIGMYFLPIPLLEDAPLIFGGLVVTGILLGIGGSLLGLRRFLT